MTINFGKKVTTRKGEQVRIITTTANHKTFPVIGIVTREDDTEVVQSWTITGQIIPGHISKSDLINPVKKVRRTGYVNVYTGGGYKSDRVTKHIFMSEEEAQKHAKPGSIAVAKVTWYEEEDGYHIDDEIPF